MMSHGVSGYGCRRQHKDTRQRTEGMGDKQGRAPCTRDPGPEGPAHAVLCASPCSCCVCLGHLCHWEEESKRCVQRDVLSVRGHLESPMARDTLCPGSPMARRKAWTFPSHPAGQPGPRCHTGHAAMVPQPRLSSEVAPCPATVTAPLPGRSLEQKFRNLKGKKVAFTSLTSWCFNCRLARIKTRGPDTPYTSRGRTPKTMLSEKPDTEATLRDSTDANRAEQAHAEKGSGRRGPGLGALLGVPGSPFWGAGRTAL